MRLALIATVFCSVTVLAILMAAGCWVILLVAERSRKKAKFEASSSPLVPAHFEQIEMSGPFFLSRGGLS